MENSIRLDLALKEKFNISRENGKELILSNKVLVNNKVVDKPSHKIFNEDNVSIDNEIVDKVNKFVSRGGFKLEAALNIFSIDIHNKKCLDIGSSTGGFTDCMLQYGALQVYAIDTGTDQLAKNLKNNSQVVSLEKTNILNITPEKIGQDFQFFSVDVSFVSVTKIIPSITKFLKRESHGVILIKPQFEAGKEFLNKKGIVKNIKVHKMITENIKNVAIANNFNVLNLIESPITGRDGNIEYLLHVFF